MARANDPKDPRFRRFRFGAYAFYILVVSVFCLLLIISVFRSVKEMTPKAAAESRTRLSVRACVEGANGLWLRLDDRRKAFSSTHPAKQVDQGFTQFRVQWLRELRDLQAKCAVDLPARKDLRELFERLEKVDDLYMTHAVQYAGEIGPEIDKLEASFARVRSEADGR